VPVSASPASAALAVAATAATATAATASATAVSAAAAKTVTCTSTQHPRLAARISRGISAALAHRTGSIVGVAASDTAEGLTCTLRQSAHFYAASVIKVTIIGALLLKKGGLAHLTRSQHDLAYQMITQSSNSAAQTLWEEVGVSHVQRFLDDAHMGQTVLNDAWGLTRITAHDELVLLHLLTTTGTVLSNSSRRYVLWLMSKVISSERWGVSADAPAGVTVHIKNGWLPYPAANDWNINSIGAFTGTGIAYQIVILTKPPSAGTGQGESYGIVTIQDAATVINRDLAGKTASSSAESAPEDAELGAPGG
jgi:hypothetical protein